MKGWRLQSRLLLNSLQTTCKCQDSALYFTCPCELLDFTAQRGLRRAFEDSTPWVSHDLCLPSLWRHRIRRNPLPTGLHFLLQQYGTAQWNLLFYFLVMDSRHHMLPGTAGPALPILIQGLKPEQISGSKHRSQVINSISAVLLPRFYFKGVSPSETHALDSHMTSNKKQVLQKKFCATQTKYPA